MQKGGSRAPVTHGIGLSKNGGGLTRFHTGVWYKGPGLEINDVGFMTNANNMGWSNWFAFVLQKPKWFYRRWQVNFNQWNAWLPDGMNTGRGGNINMNGQLKNMWFVNCRLWGRDGELLQRLPARRPRVVREPVRAGVGRLHRRPASPRSSRLQRLLPSHRRRPVVQLQPEPACRGAPGEFVLGLGRGQPQSQRRRPAVVRQLRRGRQRHDALHRGAAGPAHRRAHDAHQLDGVADALAAAVRAAVRDGRGLLQLARGEGAAGARIRGALPPPSRRKAIRAASTSSSSAPTRCCAGSIGPGSTLFFVWAQGRRAGWRRTPDRSSSGATTATCSARTREHVPREGELLVLDVSRAATERRAAPGSRARCARGAAGRLGRRQAAVARCARRACRGVTSSGAEHRERGGVR